MKHRVGNQEMSIIPERDLYRMIMRSKLPEAEKFEEWVVGEVLPAIRKSGGYMVHIENETPEELLQRAILVATEMVERQKKSIDHGYKSVIGRKNSVINGAKVELEVNREKDIVPKIQDLKEQLGACKEYATILAVQRHFPKLKAKWQDLKMYCTNCELEIKEVPDPRYGSVKSYPAEAWLHIYGVDLDELF